jgi:hypothetical protein
MRNRTLSTVGVLLWLACRPVEGAPPAVLLQEDFRRPLAADWHWGLGTWTAKDGVLRGFESGPRRHGPVKVRRFRLTDAALEVEFRLERGARFVGIGFNGPQERGHVVALVMARDAVRIIGHPAKGKSLDLLREPNTLAVGRWHRVRIELRGETLTARLNDKTYQARHNCIAEEKLTFSLGGDSGGPTGESAGALEFRNLRITE